MDVTTVSSTPPTSSPTQKKLYESPLFIVSCIVLVIALVMLGIPFLTQNQRTEQVTQTPPTVTPPLTLTVESPTDETVATDDVIAIKGKTLPNTTVAYYTNTNEGTVESDAQGNFEGTLTLANGINNLTITAFSDAGEEKSEAMTIVYDSQAQANAR